MDVMLGFLGQYLTAAEFIGKEPTLTVQKVTLEKVESLKTTEDDGGGKMRDRVVVYFKEVKDGRGLLLNRTNAEALKEMWGRETNGWLGKRITFHVQQVRVGPKVEPGIRVKGSPELKKPHTFQLKLPRKKAIAYTLLPTAAPEDVDTTTGEVTQSPPTSDLLARIAACQTVAAVEALRPEVSALPKNSQERALAVETAKAMIEELKAGDAVAGLAAMKDDVL